jgi:hypothetical protein
MKIFGIGVSKTGTTTLGACLTVLGYRHCGWNMAWPKAYMNGDMDTLYSTVEAYDSFDDWPWPAFYRELAVRYPDSKFVLTIRKDSDAWYRSMMKHAEYRGANSIDKFFFGYAAPHGYKQEMTDFYKRHNQEVMDYFKEQPDRLLVVCWETEPSWEKLCTFLGREIPSVPLPHANRRRHLTYKHHLRGLAYHARNRLRKYLSI